MPSRDRSQQAAVDAATVPSSTAGVLPGAFDYYVGGPLQRRRAAPIAKVRATAVCVGRGIDGDSLRLLFFLLTTPHPTCCLRLCRCLCVAPATLSLT